MAQVPITTKYVPALKLKKPSLHKKLFCHLTKPPFFYNYLYLNNYKKFILQIIYTINNFFV